MKIRNRRDVWIGILVGALILALVGQFAFLTQPSGSPIGAACYALAIGLFLTSLNGLKRLPEPDKSGYGRDGINWRSLPWLPAVLLTLSTMAWVQAVRLSLSPSPDSGPYRVGFQLWGVSVALFITAFLTQRPLSLRVLPWLRTARLELALVAGLTFIALLLRLLDITNIPYPLQGDEGAIGTESLRILRGDVVNMFQAGWSGQPNMSFLPTAFFIHLLGPDIAAVRMLSVLEGIVAVPLLYLLGRRMFGAPIGFMAAACLTAWHFHIHFSRVAVNNGGDAFFAVLVMWLVYRAVQTDRVLDYLWAGLAAGLTWYSYVGSRLVFALALWFLIFMAVRERSFLMKNWRGLLTFGSTIVIVAGPQMLYYSQHPDQLMTRFNQVGIIQSGWLTQESARLQVSPLSIVIEHIIRAFLAFISIPALNGFYNAPIPLLDSVSAVLFVLGLAYSTSRLLDPRHFLLVSWFWADVILGGALTVDVPNAGRLVLAAPAVCLFIALSLSLLVEALRKAGILPERVALVVAGVVLVGTMLHSINFYFREFIPRHYFVDVNSELGHVMGYYLRGLGPEYTAYFAGAPRVFIGFPSIPYLAPGVEGMDLNESVTPQTIPLLLPGRNSVFLAIPERRAEMEFIRQRYPNGVWREFPRRAADEILFLAYEVSNPD
jgi:4-amino-4-deoxy-L-arabinose transferase-like glycosyltransferase